MKGAISALAAISTALAKHGVSYVTLLTHSDGRVTINVACESDARVATLQRALVLPMSDQRQGESHWWLSTGGLVEGVSVSLSGPHHPIAELAPVAMAPLESASAALHSAAQELHS